MAKKILIPIDLDHERVFDSVFATVEEYSNPAETELVLLAVVPQLHLGYFPSIEHRYMQKLVKETKRRLEKLGSERLGDNYKWQALVEGGDPRKRIITAADELGADLIVLASHDPRGSDVIFGSVAAYVVRHAHHSILVVRQRFEATDGKAA